jgi:hypothetical protein
MNFYPGNVRLHSSIQGDALRTEDEFVQILPMSRFNLDA